MSDSIKVRNRLDEQYSFIYLVEEGILRFKMTRYGEVFANGHLSKESCEIEFVKKFQLAPEGKSQIRQDALKNLFEMATEAMAEEGLL